jgi:hypothetical protein
LTKEDDNNEDLVESGKIMESAIDGLENQKRYDEYFDILFS